MVSDNRVDRTGQTTQTQFAGGYNGQNVTNATSPKWTEKSFVYNYGTHIECVIPKYTWLRI